MFKNIKGMNEVLAGLEGRLEGITKEFEGLSGAVVDAIKKGQAKNNVAGTGSKHFEGGVGGAEK